MNDEQIHLDGGVLAIAFLECRECGAPVACLLGAEPPESCARHS